MRNERFFHPSWNKKSASSFAEKDRGEDVEVLVPARFDFIGGWTDTPPYYFENPAAVLNASLRVRPMESGADFDFPIKIKVSNSEEFEYEVNGVKTERILPDDGVGQGVFYFLDIYRPKVSIKIENRIPRGSGLGGSSLLVLALLSALRAFWLGAQEVVSSPRELVNDTLSIEQLIGSGGGWQDQMGGLLPGVKLIKTEPDNNGYSVSYLSDEAASVLEACSIIADTRMTRRAVVILSSIRDKYISKEPVAISTLASLPQSAQAGFVALENKNVDVFARLLGDAWSAVSILESATSAFLPAGLSSVANLAGYKLGGAGGGGFLLLIANSPSARKQVALGVKDLFPESILYEPSFRSPGLQILQKGKTYEIPPVSEI